MTALVAWSLAPFYLVLRLLEGVGYCGVAGDLGFEWLAKAIANSVLEPMGVVISHLLETLIVYFAGIAILFAACCVREWKKKRKEAVQCSK